MAGGLAALRASLCVMASAEALSAFEEHRHPPFAPENLVAKRHGAQVSAVRLQGRAREIADSLRDEVSECDGGAEILLMELGLVLSRIEVAARFIDEHGLIASGKKGDVWPVARLMSGWESSAAKLLDKLGLTPQARAQAAGADVLGRYLASRGDGE